MKNLSMLACALALAGFADDVGAQTMRAAVFGSGGGSISSTDATIRSLVGQPIAGLTTADSETHTAGFISLLIADPGMGVPIEDDTPIGSGIPEAFELQENYPNPFNPQTTIRFGITEPSHVRLAVYDVMGREVRVLVDNVLAAGWHNESFSATRLPSGTYFYRIDAGEFHEVRSMLLVR